MEILVTHRARKSPALPQPASLQVPGANCATDPARWTEAATADVKLLQLRQRPAPCHTLRQPRRHYAVPASSDDAQIAPADKDLRWLAQVTAPRDVLTARQNRRPCNAICPGPSFAGHVSRGAIWRTLSPGTRAQPDEPTCSIKRHRCQCRVPRRPARRPRHKTGVVSRVPRSSRNAQAFGTDRNTYLTSTHQRRHMDNPGQPTDERKEANRTAHAEPERRIEATPQPCYSCYSCHFGVRVRL